MPNLNQIVVVIALLAPAAFAVTKGYIPFNQQTGGDEEVSKGP